MRKKHHAEFDYNAAWGAPVKRAGSLSHPDEEPEPEEVLEPVYYRALYDFESTNPDELCFAAGTIIQVSFVTLLHNFYLAL